MKKVIIIGGGVSGLTTAIYLKINGYDTVVLEKNSVVGGACIGWRRQGCYIDGCIHWLVGTKRGSKTYGIWEDVGALSADTRILYPEDFYTVRYPDGKSLTVYSDLERLRGELLKISPEDKKQINDFCKRIKRFQKIDAPVDKPADLMNIFELMKVGVTMLGDYIQLKKNERISCEEYAQRFKSPYIRKWLSEHMSSGYNLMSMLYMLAHVSMGDGGIPEGGSFDFSMRMREKYLSLGGELRCSAEVDEILVKDGRAYGARLLSGEEIYSDWVVAATPVEHTLKKLLTGKFPLKKIDMRLADRRTYPIYTYTTAVLKISSPMDDKPLSEKIYFEEPITLENDRYDVTYRNYGYDKTMHSLDGATVVQATLSGDDDSYFWWENVKNSGQYEAKKAEIGERIIKIYTEIHPDLEGKIELIDFITPLTYQRYLNGRHGSFQAFVQTAGGKSLMQKGAVSGLSGFVLSGQWILQSGGLPPAGITGRFAAQRICRADGVKFKRR